MVVRGSLRTTEYLPEHVINLVYPAFYLFFLYNSGYLESFHSALLKNTPKPGHCVYTSMREQTHFAVMEHNKIVGQKPARDTDTTTSFFSADSQKTIRRNVYKIPLQMDTY